MCLWKCTVANSGQEPRNGSEYWSATSVADAVEELKDDLSELTYYNIIDVLSFADGIQCIDYASIIKIGNKLTITMVLNRTPSATWANIFVLKNGFLPKIGQVFPCTFNKSAILTLNPDGTVQSNGVSNEPFVLDMEFALAD